MIICAPRIARERLAFSRDRRVMSTLRKHERSAIASSAVNRGSSAAATQRREDIMSVNREDAWKLGAGWNDTFHWYAQAVIELKKRDIRPH
jgi:hypothetical protein